MSSTIVLETFDNPEASPSTESRKPDSRDTIGQLSDSDLFNYEQTSQPGDLQGEKPGVLKAHAAVNDGFEPAAQDDFFDQVDDRMSRNSLEYPEQQARHVSHWILEADELMGSRDFEHDNWGNVIGIRGFSAQISADKRIQRRIRLNKLRVGFKKLKAENRRLHAQLEDLKTEAQSNRKAEAPSVRTKAKRGGQPTGRPKNVASDGDFAHTDKGQPCSGCQLQLPRLRHQAQLLQTRLEGKEEIESERYKVLLAERDRLQVESSKREKELAKEIERLREKLKNLSIEPCNKLLLALRRENCRLKDATELNLDEFHQLRENYVRLESELSSMMREQKCLLDEKNEELSSMMVELCRLQVYQPKLEMTLKTEREIKHELQVRLDTLEEQNEHLNEQLVIREQELNKSRAHSGRLESVEIERLLTELKSWKEKYYRLRDEKGQLEEIMRTIKSNASQWDTRHQSELEAVREGCKVELAEMGKSLAKVREDRDSLRSQLDILAPKLEEMEREKMELERVATDSINKLEIANAKQELIERNLDQLECGETALRSQICELEAKNKGLLGELDTCREELKRSCQQTSELQTRFKSQQRAFEELRARKEEELARLRVNLNFEQYNRQVALRGIEKELRVSLRELEAMKQRFCRRIAQGGEIFEGARTDRSSANGLGQSSPVSLLQKERTRIQT